MLPLPSEIKENKITSFETYMENFEFLKYLSALMTHNKSKENDKRIHARKIICFSSIKISHAYQIEPLLRLKNKAGLTIWRLMVEQAELKFLSFRKGNGILIGEAGMAIMIIPAWNRIQHAFQT